MGNEETIWCGSAKEITTQYGQMMKLSFNKSDIKTLEDNLNEKGWVNAVCVERRNPAPNATHSIKINTWKPKNNYEKQVDEAYSESDDNSAQNTDEEETAFSDDVPF